MHKPITDWPVRRLSDVVSLPSGQVSPLRAPYSEQILIAPDHVESGTGRLLELRTAADQGASSSKYIVKPGDVVYSKIRPALRKAVLAKFEGLCSADMYPMTPSDEIDSRYLLALLLSEQFSRFAESVSGRSGIPKINRSELEEFSISLPPIEEQREIAEVLDSIDDSIRSSVALIAKLKLKNSGFERDLLNRIDVPAQPLACFLSTRPRNGFSPNEVESWTGTVALGLGCLTPDGFTPKQLKNVPSGDPRYASAWLSDGDLLISRSNTFELVGLVGRYRDAGTPCVYPDLMMKLTPNMLVRAEFLELVLRNADIREKIKRMSQGTSGSMVKISASALMKLTMKIPDLYEQDRLLSIYATERAVHEAEEREIAKLQKLKQGIMNDLLTGCVRLH